MSFNGNVQENIRLFVFYSGDGDLPQQTSRLTGVKIFIGLRNKTTPFKSPKSSGDPPANCLSMVRFIGYFFLFSRQIVTTNLPDYPFRSTSRRRRWGNCWTPNQRPPVEGGSWAPHVPQRIRPKPPSPTPRRSTARFCYGWIDGLRKSHGRLRIVHPKFTSRPALPPALWSRSPTTVPCPSACTKPGNETPLRPPRQEKKKIRSPPKKGIGPLARCYDSPGKGPPGAGFSFFARWPKNQKSKAPFFATLNKTNLYSSRWRLQTGATHKPPETRLPPANSLHHRCSRGGKKFQLGD